MYLVQGIIQEQANNMNPMSVVSPTDINSVGPSDIISMKHVTTIKSLI